MPLGSARIDHKPFQAGELPVEGAQQTGAHAADQLAVDERPAADELASDEIAEAFRSSWVEPASDA